MNGCVCKRTYQRIRGMKLQNTAEGIRAGIFNNPQIFTNPPNCIAEFTNIITDYTNKRIAHYQEGSVKNHDYIIARKNIMELIDRFADNVDQVSKFDSAIIALAGFKVSYDS